MCEGRGYRRNARFPALAASLLALLAAVSSRQDLSIAADNGFFERNGLKPEITRLATGTDILTAVHDGSLDIGYSAIDATASVISNGFGVSLLVTTNGQARNMPYPVRADSDIHTPADLAGRSIGIGAPPIFKALAGAYLAHNGVDPAKAGPMKLGGLTERERRERERLRLVAAELFAHGVRQAAVDRRLEVSPQAVSQWHQRWVRDGEDGLLSTGPSLACPYLDDDHVRQDRGRRGESGQQPGGDRVQLADVAEGEPAQERAQRRGRAHVVEQPGHPAVAQQAHIADRVRAGDHARDQREDLRRGVRAARRRDPHPLGQQGRQPTPGGQRHHRREAAARHEIRIIEPHRHRAPSMR
jgi:hypothetical protein